MFNQQLQKKKGEGAHCVVFVSASKAKGLSQAFRPVLERQALRPPPQMNLNTQTSKHLSWRTEPIEPHSSSSLETQADLKPQNTMLEGPLRSQCLIYSRQLLGLDKTPSHPVSPAFVWCHWSFALPQTHSPKFFFLRASVFNGSSDHYFGLLSVQVCF